MPLRNTVPTLQLLTIRNVAWPQALRKMNQMRVPGERFGSHRHSFASMQSSINNVLSSLRRESYGTSSDGMTSVRLVIEAIVNAWIRLSDYYDTRIDEIKSLNYILGPGTVTKLDFLHRGFFMRDGTDITPFAGVVPSTVPAQKVNPYTWQAIVSTLKSSGNLTSLMTLYISFGLTSKVSDISGYHFPRTFSYFTRLTKLVMHGVANDNLMIALGTYCRFLRYLDIRKTEVTEKGVIGMLLIRPADIKKFSAAAKFTFPATFLSPLTHTLEYFDMSTMRREGSLLEQDKVVRLSCPHLRGTPGRLFFRPEGSMRFTSTLNSSSDLDEVRNKAMSSVRTQLAETIVELAAEFLSCHHQHCGIHGVELRVNSTGEETGLFFYHRQLLVVEVGFREMTVINISSHTISVLDFLPLESLVKIAPNLRHIKASLKGELSSDHIFEHLKTITMPMAHEMNTLKTIVQFCKKLVYVEVREVLLAPGLINDQDMIEMVGAGCDHLETFRLLFKNSISLVPGIKYVTLHCPNLKILGDLKFWAIPFATLSRFSLNLNAHNLDVAFEYNGIIYNSNTPCKEFYV